MIKKKIHRAHKQSSGEGIEKLLENDLTRRETNDVVIKIVLAEIKQELMGCFWPCARRGCEASAFMQHDTILAFNLRLCAIKGALTGLFILRFSALLYFIYCGLMDEIRRAGVVCMRVCVGGLQE